jgi:capsular exopolysaccharide synthesis family protein
LQQSTRAADVSLSPSKQDLALTDMWLVIRKRRVLLAVLAVGLAILAVAAGYKRGDRYTATGQIEIQPGSAADLKQSISSVLSSGTSSLDNVIESDILILNSETLLMKVAGTLKLQNDPDFLSGQTAIKTSKFGGQVIPLLHGNLDDPHVRAVIVQILRANMTVGRVPRTQMISISYKSRSPQLSANVVNALESEYIENNFIAHYSNTKQVSQWLTGQIEGLRAVVQDSQDRMVDLQKKLGISALDPQHSMIVQEITNLEKGVSDATQQRVLEEARYHMLQSLPPDQIQDSPTPLGSDGGQSLLTSLRSQRAAAVSELARLQPVYGPNYPQIKQLNAQSQSLDREIAKQEQRVVNQAKDATGIAQAAESKATGMLESRVHELYGQRDDLVQYELLSQEYESNRHMYESILARLREAAVDAGLDSADISVVDLASLPVAPSSMPPATMGMLGLFFGAFGGLAFALLLERLDTRMRDSRQIQDLLGLPAIAVVPQTNWKAIEKTKDFDPETAAGPEILWDSRSAFSEAMRVFRTSIQLSSTSRQSRVIAVTSCQPGEGKSTLSTNLAAALAQGGKRVVVVDTDMRRPSLLWRLKLTGKRGLSEYLTGAETLEGIIQTHKTLTTLDMIPSGSAPPLPADLLASDQMKHFVEQLRERYEYVILDTPPALSVTDPLIVSSLADGLVLVIRQGVCTRAMLSRAAEIFHDVGIKVYGFVLNGVDASLPEYYGYLGYYAYNYKAKE